MNSSGDTNNRMPSRPSRGLYALTHAAGVDVPDTGRVDYSDTPTKWCEVP